MKLSREEVLHIARLARVGKHKKKSLPDREASFITAEAYSTS